MAHTLIGTVTSDKRDKTITVSIVSRETHPLYRKQYSKTRKYTAHDPENIAHVGDRVQIEMTRPISKTKSYTLVKVLEKSRGTVELKEGVTEVVQEKKIGADEIARAKATEAEATETEESASEVAEKDAEGEDK
ncbi:30S ribosomal protein S17 [Candidatus Saccharibacteria bacterium]|nr:30S ribosomal protein S17 [Candidatus Saccharibacteria bacterium]